MMQVDNACLSMAEIGAFGHYNAGYISVDGIMYLVFEISSTGIEIKLTRISDGWYKLNPVYNKSY